MERKLCLKGMQGKKNYQEKLFTSFQLSEHVPDDNIYRRLKAVIDLQWLYKATVRYYGKEGQQSIDPVVFFKLILIGYLENLASDRKIISMASMRMDMLYFIGYDIDEPLPWHSTLSRTRQLYSQHLFKKLFRKVLKQCIDAGMVAGRRQVIDSVFVKANASMDSLVEKGVLEDADLYVVKLCEQPKEEGSNKCSNDNYYSPSDPDAKVATKRGKATRMNYLAQVSVDSNSHVITNIEAHLADKRDSECLIDVVTHTINNLEPHGLLVEEIIADANYSSGTVLEYLEANDLVGYIPNVGAYKNDRPGFAYDQQKDEYVCSQGIHITYRGLTPSRSGRYNKIYSSLKKDCVGCELRDKCLGNAMAKTIRVTQDKRLFEQMHDRMQTSKGKRMKKVRQSTVEPVLGTLVDFLGIKQVNTKGIEQANKCVTMAALAYNLKKLLKFKGPKHGLAAEMINKYQKMVNICLFNLYRRLYSPVL